MLFPFVLLVRRDFMILSGHASPKQASITASKKLISLMG